MKHILLLATFLIIIMSTISCSLFPTGTSEPPPPDKPMETFLRDYEYVIRRVFDLALPIDNLQPTDKVTKLIMYESVLSYNADVALPVANFYAIPEDTSQYKSESILGNDTKVKEIPADEFTVWNNSERNLHYVVFESQRSRNVALGYYMEVTDSIGSIRTFGNLNDIAVVGTDTTQVYSLKLLAQADANYRVSHETWQLMWRNCYEIPRGIPLVYMTIKVIKGLDGTENFPSNQTGQGENPMIDFLEILGLDLENSYSQINIPDGIVDEKPEIYRPDWGLLIFPSRKPFDDTVSYRIDDRELPELDVKISELYDYTSWTEKTEASEYFIRFEWLE